MRLNKVTGARSVPKVDRKAEPSLGEGAMETNAMAVMKQQEVGRISTGRRYIPAAKQLNTSGYFQMLSAFNITGPITILLAVYLKCPLNNYKIKKGNEEQIKVLNIKIVYIFTY